MGAVLITIAGVSGIVSAGSLDDHIRAAGADIKVLSVATDAAFIQWTALLYLNQNYGAEIYVVVIRPSPLFGCKMQSSPDRQFHLVHIGRAVGMDEATLADSITACVFGHDWPDVAIWDAGSPEDSALIAAVLSRIRDLSEADTFALNTLERIYLRAGEGAEGDVVLNDAEFYANYAERIQSVSPAFGSEGPLNYKPERFRRYRLVPPVSGAVPEGRDFISGMDRLRLPKIVSRLLTEGPEKKNVTRRLAAYRSNLNAAGQTWLERGERLRHLMSAYNEISRLSEAGTSGSSQLGGIDVESRIKSLQWKTLAAIQEAVGLVWSGHVQIRQTPFGRAGKLTLDVELTGPLPVELGCFKFRAPGKEAVTIDSIFAVVQPHQRFFREYPVDLNDIIVAGDSLPFYVEVNVGDLMLNLDIPFSELTEADIAISFLPGYTFIAPFTEDQITALAQPFDWQLRITKPYTRELDAEIEINNPDGIVVGTFDRHVFMPEGVTSRYMDIHLAAGRSVGYDLHRVTAALKIGEETVAETGADVRVIRCQVPDTRDIAFIPDPGGRLEDFLRIARVSFQPFTLRSLIRARLEAYDLIIIGAEADAYYATLRSVSDRLREFVRGGGEIIVFGQSFGWPYDIFDFTMYTSRSLTPVPARIVSENHSLLTEPYAIRTEALLKSLTGMTEVYPAIISGGTEVMSAGELGSYLKVSTIGDGHIIYCGLPLLSMAAELDVEAIHLMANLLNFGHGN